MVEVFDAGILQFFQQLHHPVLTEFFKFFTTIGEAGLVWIFTGILLLIKKENRKYGVILLLALILCLIFGNGLLKNIVARPRPCWRHPEMEMLIPIPTDYSFPSGHTFSSFAGAVCISYWKKKWGYIAFLVAVLIAVSRLYFFVHYPTDILGGAVFGTLMALTSIFLVEKSGIRKKEVS